MHTVAAGYLRPFTDTSSGKNKPHVWQHDRTGHPEKLISVRDASVSKGIYKLGRADGTSDTTIESELLSKGVDAELPAVVELLAAGGTPNNWQWRDLSRYTAFQLARTPHMFQLHRDEAERHGLETDIKDPPLAMVSMAPHLEKRLCAMHWTICTNRSTKPFLTSDHPVAMWADRGDGAEIGVGFIDPALQILFPLTPKLCLMCEHTETSIKSVVEDSPSTRAQFTDFYPMTISQGWFDVRHTLRANQIIVTNA